MKEIKINHVDEVIYVDETKEGMPIYMWVNEKVNNFYMTLNVKYGSIDTEFKLKGDKKYTKVPSGVAHFLEHVTFNEEDNSSAFDYFKQFGSSINAFTSFDITAYEVMGSSKFSENLNHLLDYVFTPYMTKGNVEKEKGIIVEEISMGDNQPGRRLFFGVYESLFQVNKRKFSIAGTKESVKETTLEDLVLVYNNFYHPKNMFVVITGNFNPYEASALIKENLGIKSFPEYRDPIKKRDKEPLEVVSKKKDIPANIEIPKLRIALKIPRKKFREKNDLKLEMGLGIVLSTNFGFTSDLREELMAQELVNSMGFSREIIDDYMIVGISAETKYLSEVTDRFINKLNELSISKETLIRRRKSSIANMVLAYDNIELINNEIQDNIMTYDEIITDRYDMLKKLSINDLNDIIDDLDTSNMMVVRMVPNPDKDN